MADCLDPVRRFCRNASRECAHIDNLSATSSVGRGWIEIMKFWGKYKVRDKYSIVQQPVKIKIKKYSDHASHILNFICYIFVKILEGEFVYFFCQVLAWPIVLI